MGAFNDAWDQFKKEYNKRLEEEKAKKERASLEDKVLDMSDEDIFNQYEFLFALRVAGMSEDGTPVIQSNVHINSQGLMSIEDMRGALLRVHEHLGSLSETDES